VAEGRGGVVKKFLDHTTPSARADVASRLFLDRASTPPPAEEGNPPVPLPGDRLPVLRQVFGSPPCNRLKCQCGIPSAAGSHHGRPENAEIRCFV